MIEVYVSMRHTPLSMYYRGWIEKGLDARIYNGFNQIRNGEFPKELADKIKACSNFLVILTPDTFGQDDDNESWMAYETEIALKANINIIPVVSADFVWPNELPERLKGLRSFPEIIMFGHKMISSDYDKIKTSIKEISKRLLDDNKKDVFISYSSKENHIAKRIKNSLESLNISCWMAPDSIPAGSDYTREISKAIKNSKIFILLLSENSQNSRWVSKELDMAIAQNLKIIPLHIDKSKIIDGFDFCLIDCQIINAYGRENRAIDELLDEAMNSI